MGMPTVISAFAGCGGSSLGYRQAGFRELLAVEWDANSVKVFAANFPGVPVYADDICKLSAEKAMDMAGIRPGKLDVLDGSPPCQGFSPSGSRIVGDKRNNLFREFVRLIEGIRPRIFVMENVVGMTTGPMRGWFNEALTGLKATGYSVQCRILNAADFEVPQRRKRLLFIGILGTFPDGIWPGHKGRVPIWRIIGSRKSTGGRLNSRQERMWMQTRPGHSFADIAGNGRYFNHWRLDPFSQAPTILAVCSKKISHWDIPEWLGWPEIALLQSFPADFDWCGLPPSAICRLIGNSVPPKMMEAIASQIKKTALDVRAAPTRTLENG